MKFLLSLTDTLEAKINKIASDVIEMKQSYLQRNKELTVRIRKSLCDGETKHYMTVKVPVEDNIVEVEKKISSDDYNRLATKAYGWVNKYRYLVPFGRLTWEVDFFKNEGENYFVMAEIELPEGVLKPDSLPPFVEDNLIYAVPREDTRFSSKKISDVQYAKKILSEVSGVIQEESSECVARSKGVFGC